MFTGYMAISKDSRQPRAFAGAYVFASVAAVTKSLEGYCRKYDCDLVEELANTDIIKARVTYD